jgi:hypothetical protein
MDDGRLTGLEPCDYPGHAVANVQTGSRRVISSILVFWIGLIALGPIIHDDLGHDQDCAPALVHHDASRHKIDAAPSVPRQGSNHAACSDRGLLDRSR